MRRFGRLLTIAGLGLGAALAVAWLLRDTSVPLVPLQPAMPVGVTPAGLEPAAPARADAERPDRQELPPVVDTRPAVLVVEVRRPGSGAAPGPESIAAGTPHEASPTAGAAALGDPVGDVEVEVTLDGPGAERRVGSTDASGLVQFEFVGGEGRTATLRCAVATSRQVQLHAAAPVHVALVFCWRGSARGRVVDATGRGIAGADLVLLPTPAQESTVPRVRRVGQSRRDGSFEVALAIGGALGAVHPDYAPSAMWPVPVQSDPTLPATVTVLQLSLLTAPSGLQGRVLDAASRPVADAHVEFRSVGTPPAGAVLVAPPRRLRTAPDGTFLVDDLRPGQIEFAARAAGAGSQRGSLELAAGTMKVLEIRLLPPCEVQGRVVDADGNPIAGARVWSGGDEDFASVVAVTGPDGTFQLTDLPPGDVVLNAREGAARVGEPTARRATTRLQLVADQVGHWVATLQAAGGDGYLRGQLVDREGARLPTWRLVVRNRNGFAEGKTDSGGFFHVRPPGGGLLDVFVHAPGSPPDGFAHTVLRGVVAGPSAVRIVVDRQQPTGSLTGRVEDRNRAALAATLTCWHHQRQEQARYTCAANGTFRIDGAPPGTIDLYVDHPGYARAVRPTLVVLADRSLDLDTVSLDEGAVLHGTVTGPDGQPPADLQVTLRTAGQPVAGEYLAGVYRFSNAPPGRHVLQVQGTAVAAANFVVELRPGVDTQRDMELAAGVPRRLVVRGPRIAGTSVSLVLRTPGTAHTWFGTTGLQLAGEHARGEFVAYMAPGTYEATAWTGDAWEAHGTVDFVAGDELPVTLELVTR